ncbi:MAG TPA: sigma-70 family RNA polymerase sigma factor [Blastocatellia bacterium]|nr:sigma-70 family RNA polymerase sigma factor [Blastocatellia bacterium]
MKRSQQIQNRTDSDLVVAARSGEAVAFGELVRKHQRQSFAIALSVINDPAEAEDLTQEAFIRAFRNLDLLVDPEKFVPWLRRITFGVCIDWLRAFRPELYRSGDVLEEKEEFMKSNAPSPLEQLEKLELSNRVLNALSNLPQRYRVPLTMYHIDGLSHEKVAKALNIPVGTVRSLVTRARQKLVPILEEYAKEVLVMNRDADEVFQEQSTRARILHIFNGDSARGTLEESGAAGDFSVWADVLHEGPVPAGLSVEEFREVRSRFHAGQNYGFSYERAYEMQKRWDDKLVAFAEYDEVILWFEHDLFDQLILIHLLDYYARQSLGKTKLSLICIGEFPGVEPFIGIGQLYADQLASLLVTRQNITEAHLKLGREAWHAFTSPDPTEIEKIIQTDTSALPFLADALKRFLQEYPSTRNGLGRTEMQILSLLEDGPKSPAALFRATYPLEERVFMGDTTFWSRVKVLSSGPHPLVELDITEREGRLPEGEVRITNPGLKVLAGTEDWVKLNGIDRWFGGVYQNGTEATWRWNDEIGKLERSL